jgi:[FeFe] hydrogenase H-cluster radical SAM maturase HydG
MAATIYTKLRERTETSPRIQKVDFIDQEKIQSDLEQATKRTKEEIREILTKAKEAKGLTPMEAAALLQTTDPELKSEIYAAAGEVKETIYGKRIVLFAPLYLSNYCVNNCKYCGYGCYNKITRKKLTMAEIAEEVKVLERMGHKRLALEVGEDPQNCPIEYVLDAIKVIYNTSEEQGTIRRVNVNIAATTVENYSRLKEAGIGTYILFQETYHQETYEEMHPTGPKSSYYYHTTAIDRAMQGGIDDVGAGVLFGLYDYKFEVLAMLYHALYLEENFGAGPHTISVPRLKPAVGMTLEDFPCFTKAVETLRRRKIRVCAHIILGLPCENKKEMFETALAAAALDIQGIKIHSLHVLRGTPLADQYIKDQFLLLTMKEYIELVADILEILPKNIVIHRLMGDGPTADVIAPEWTRHKWEVLNGIDKEMARRGSFQGEKKTESS